jgi:hypothetical protein
LTPGATPPSEPAQEPGTRPALAANRFNDRVAEAAGAIDRLLDDVRAAARNSDMTAAAEAASAVEQIALAERAWVGSNPAARCYEQSYESALNSYDELLTAADAVKDDAAAGRSNAINHDLGGTNGDISALTRAGTRAVSACS